MTHNTGQRNQEFFCPETKISYFEDFLMLKMIGTFVLLCKLSDRVVQFSLEIHFWHYFAIFEIFVLNPIGTFILLCKLAKTAKNAVKPAKKSILGTFFTPPFGGRGSNRNMAFKALICDLFDRGGRFLFKNFFRTILII